MTNKLLLEGNFLKIKIFDKYGMVDKAIINSQKDWKLLNEKIKKKYL